LRKKRGNRSHERRGRVIEKSDSQNHERKNRLEADYYNRGRKKEKNRREGERQTTKTYIKIVKNMR
jgi:hypothetical protein